ncbi:copper-binding protein [Rhodocyclus purpureus]|uniref:copper-binding protein n=1 Tax=Rhodocyclus purpureus TaxID=1067 RepID=UPI001913317A|nr:copper-binding protein [Rhodocyclus purpureus]MBK5913302.1 hypothetical protein [Rhodocyclus purpureus]
MKNSIVPGLVAVLLLSPALGAVAHEGKAGQGAMHASTGQASTPSTLIDGVVKKLDKAGGKLTVSHGPLPNGMPAMTMSFKVKEAAWLDKVTESSRISFASETIDGAMTIVRLELR